MSAKIFIDGEHGTTGLQIRARMADRRDVELLSIPETERRNAAMREDLLNSADIAILCLPDDASKEAVAMTAANPKVRIIDTSTAFRVHPDWAYGFAEMDSAQAEKIRSARYVANPAAIHRRNRPDPSAAHGGPASGRSRHHGQRRLRLYRGGKQLIAQMEDESHAEHIASPHFLYGLTLKHMHVPEMREHGLLNRSPLFSPSVGASRRA